MNYICNAVNAERLADLGIHISSEYLINSQGESYLNPTHSGQDIPGGEFFYAYGIGELGDMLPDSIIKEGRRHQNLIFKHEGKYHCQFYNFCTHSIIGQVSKTMADAIALMVIWLIENDYVKIADINSDLVLEVS